jgi:DNA-binding transcriptional ArsR family regulator
MGLRLTVEISLIFSTVMANLGGMKRKFCKPDDAPEPQLAALASPLRMELIGALRAHGGASIREIAAELDRPADGLYHHVRKLVKAGIVVERGQRKVGRRMEAVYALSAERFAGRLDPTSAPSKRTAIGAGTAAIRLAAREFKAAVETDAMTLTKGLPNLRASRQRTWLTDEGLVRLHRLLAQIERLLLAESKPKRGRPHSLTIVLAPCIKRRTFPHGSS